MTVRSGGDSDITPACLVVNGTCVASGKVYRRFLSTFQRKLLRGYVSPPGPPLPTPRNFSSILAPFSTGPSLETCVLQYIGPKEKKRIKAIPRGYRLYRRYACSYTNNSCTFLAVMCLHGYDPAFKTFCARLNKIREGVGRIQFLKLPGSCREFYILLSITIFVYSSRIPVRSTTNVH